MVIINNYIKNDKLIDDEITIIALHLGHGGIEQYISSLCKMLEKKYKINLIVTYKISSKPEYYFSNKINIRYLISGKPNKEELKEAINKRSVIHIIREVVRSFKLLALKKYRNIKAISNVNSKYIITTRDYHNKLVGRYANSHIIKIATEHNYHNNDVKYINILIRSLKNFDYLVCVSDELKRFYQKKLVKTKCVFIPNVIDNLPDKECLLKDNVLINIGRIEKEKGQSDLIDVVNIVKKTIKDIKLYIIGDGSLRKELEKKVEDYNLEKNVFFTGFISKKEMEKYFVNSKLFVLTSYTESFGLVLIEAMSYRVPCIAFDSANGAKNLLSNDVGVLVKNRNINQMAKEIIELLNNDKKLNKYSKSGYNECSKYLLTNVEDKWFNLLDNY